MIPAPTTIARAVRRFRRSGWKAAGLSAALAVSATPAIAEERGAIADVDAFVEEALSRIDRAPGLALAIARADGPVFAAGYGLAEVETAQPATADTLYYIASTTKAFTALSANILHHRGVIDLDATLAEFAPDADFGEAIDPAAITLRDLVTLRSGVNNPPIGFRAAFTGQHDAATMWRLLAETAPIEDAPHGTFQYQNDTFNIFSILVERQTGRDWREIVETEILDPARMRRTTAYPSRAREHGWPMARPYFGAVEGPPERLYLEKQDNTMQSAGGLYSTANDIANWLQVQLSDGRLGGRRIIPAGVVRETQQPAVPANTRFMNFEREHYGMGAYVGSYEGETNIHAFGAFSGFFSHVSFMPERDLGVAVFVNDSATGAMLGNAIAGYVYDRFAEIEGLDAKYEELLGQIEARQAAAIRAVAADRARRAERVSQLTLPAEAYGGVYENNAYGRIHLSVDAGAFDLRFGNLRARAEPFTEPDAIRVEFTPLRGETIRFETNDGGVAALEYRGAMFRRGD